MSGADGYYDGPVSSPTKYQDGVGVISFNHGHPKVEDYELLYQYQQQTPASYNAARPRLYAIAKNATVKFVPSQWPEDTAFVFLTMQDNADESDAPPPQADGFIHCTGIDVWVTSENIILHRPVAEGGVKIRYYSIPVHGVLEGNLYLQLISGDEDNPDPDDVDSTFIELRIDPNSVDSYDQEDIAKGGDLNDDGSINTVVSMATTLQKAVAACQDLNPDPPVPGEEGEEMEEDTRPGASGWITSDNMADFMDEDGNFRMPQGTTVIGGNGANGHGMNENGTNGHVMNGNGVVGDESYETNGNGVHEEQEPLGPGAGTRRTAADAVESGTLEEADRPRPSGSVT